MKKRIPVAILALALAGLARVGWAQDSTDGAVVLEAIGGADAEDPLGLGLNAGGMTRSVLIADGTYLSRWTGRLVESAPGLWVIAFDTDADGASPGPVMPVLPGQRLLEMQQMVRDRNGDVTFRVGGHVTIFGGRNYFLPRVVSTVSRPVAPVADVLGAGKEQEADPSVEALLARVREAAPATEVLLRTRQEEHGEERRLMSEGATMLSVVGRAIRRDEGVVEFVVDNGMDGVPATDAPLVVMPCLLAEEMGALVDEQGDRVRFSLSGEVFVYGGRNYVMPVLYRVEPRDRMGGIRPAR